MQAGMSWKVMAGLALAMLALLWFWAPSALPIALGLVLVVLIFQWRALAAVQVYFEQAQPAEPAFPLGYEAEFVESARELARQGFVPLGRFVQRMQPGQDDWGETHWFASASGDTLVVLQPPAELERADHLLKSVITSGADGRLLGSGTVSPVMRMFELPEFPTHIVPPAPMAQVLRAHRQWLNLLHVQPVPLATDPEGLTPDTAMALVHAHLQRQFRLLQAKGRVTPDAQGGWRLHYDPAIAVAYAAITEAAAAEGEQTLWRLYDQVTAQTLVLRGADSDLLSRDTAAQMAERGPRAQWVEWAGVGHAPTLIAPEQLAVVLNFLLP